MTAQEFLIALENARILFESGQIDEDTYMEYVEGFDGQSFSDSE